MIKLYEFDAWNVTTKMQEKMEGLQVHDLTWSHVKSIYMEVTELKNVSISARFQFIYAL